MSGVDKNKDDSSVQCSSTMANGADGKEREDMDFVEDLIRCQSKTRMHDQRSPLPMVPDNSVSNEDHEESGDDEDEKFFQFLSKMQCDRFDEQRAHLNSTTQGDDATGKAGDDEPSKNTTKSS